MSSDDLWGSKGAYCKSFEDLATFLMNSTKLNKEQALAIWDGYCHKRKIHRQKKIHGRVLIADAYDIKAYKQYVHNLSDMREDALFHYKSCLLIDINKI